MESVLLKIKHRLRGETGTQESAKFLGVGSTPTGASNFNHSSLQTFIEPPEPIPTMAGGWVVPPFDPTITKCGYCGRNLEWRHVTKMIYSNATPYKQWTYGCPLYGQPSPVPSSDDIDKRTERLASGEPWKYGSYDEGIGWHYHWWEDGALFNAVRENRGLT